MKESLTHKCNVQSQTIAKQQQTIEALQSQDRTVRSEFTKVLGSPQRLGGEYWGRSSQQTTLSWEEIFFQIGSISARLFNHETRQEIDNLREQLSEVQTKIK